MKPIFKTTFIVLAILGTLTLPLFSYERNDNKNSNCFTDTRDGHIYRTVTIGTQTWMAENLAYLPKVHLLSEISESKARYYVYDYNGSTVSDAQSAGNYKMVGVLYNWPAAIKACPEGWHLPGDKEWTMLENYLITEGYNYDNSKAENKIAKSLSATTGWATGTENGEGCIGYNPETNNRSGFNALPAGHYEGNAFFTGVGVECRWWSKKQLGKIYAWVRMLNISDPGKLGPCNAGLNKVEDLKYYGLSVRCVKD